MKLWIKVTLPLVLVAAVGLATLRGLRKPEAATTASTAASAAPSPELARSRDLNRLDVLTLAAVTLTQGVEVSGTLKAVNTAVVKAKVAADSHPFLPRLGRLEIVRLTIVGSGGCSMSIPTTQRCLSRSDLDWGTR